MKFSVNLPIGVRGVRMKKNSFFVELEDEDGNITQLNGTEVMQRVCVDQRCGFEWFSTSNMGQMRCPECHCATVGKWMRMQQAFLPTEESKFKPPEQTGD